ncbi:RodZ domain-containing protein [Aliiglaciecola lipolytica]|uniref:Cytoskeleton protein RodZ n=1 Tax=Aliiglaciecola lipolytica E3 TaxID=1127673 RepID=K6YAD0_9ALTE|nr:RodZ domain-containing protein [Aliiglaciecola lipolytica]GAC15147.1 cytoskeleton protein RodZ [Aliiglaciecola lipolytica E3]
MTEEQQEQPVSVKGPGAILKEAREKSGLTVGDIANKLHLKANIIAAIESDEYDPKISMTFTKGYLKLYAKQVQVKEEVVLEAFASQYEQEKEPAKLQSFSKRVAKQANDDRLMLITYGIVAAMLALVVIWWLQQDSSDNSVSNPVSTVETTDTAQTFEEPELSEQPTADDLIISAQIEQDNAAEIEESNLQPEDTVSEPDTIELATEETTEQQTADLKNIELVFEFSENCWMNLVDATGEAIAYGVKKQGRVMTVSGVAPFEVTLGAPQVVQISYDGVQVDMSRFDAGKTAKFSLPFAP